MPRAGADDVGAVAAVDRVAELAAVELVVAVVAVDERAVVDRAHDVEVVVAAAAEHVKA